MYLMSWNVNGIRAALSKGLADFVTAEQPDILCLQEIKAKPEQIAWQPEGYQCLWNPAQRAGYSGTAILSRLDPIARLENLSSRLADDEGRVIGLEFTKFFLITVYTPNAKRDLSRLDFRCGTWDPTFLKIVKELEEEKPVIFCGDLNTAHREEDLANPKTNRKNAGFTEQERNALDQFEKAGFIDSFRQFHQGNGHYTWWSYRPGIRERNIGWRIDYFWLSKNLKSDLQSVKIHADVLGSDHCPISIKLGFD